MFGVTDNHPRNRDVFLLVEEVSGIDNVARGLVVLEYLYWSLFAFSIPVVELLLRQIFRIFLVAHLQLFLFELQ